MTKDGASRAEHAPARPRGFSTRAIHDGQEPDTSTGAVVTPIHLSSTFAQSGVGEHLGFEYARTGNPTRRSLERTLASLEGARFGFAFSSGMAAEDAVLRMLRPGDHAVLPDDAYGGTFRLVSRVYGAAGVTHGAAGLGDPGALEAAWRPETRLVWIESPSNPMLRIVDIEATAEVAHRLGGICVVDNTFATPYLQQPLGLGADIVVHSATKYLGGHSDVVAGFVATNDEVLAAHLGFVQNAVGAVPSPFDCYLVQRGVKTLAVRMDRQCASARSIALHLLARDDVAEVHYPGLASHAGHDLAARQMLDFGAMVSFTLAGGEKAALAVASRTSLFTLAESLGAVESLIEHPARMTHASAAGSPLEVDPGLIRLSIGLENVGDLLADLDAALGPC